MPAVSRAQQKFFGIVRAIQKGEMAPTTPETAKAAADMKKKDVKDFASTKHKGLPDKKIKKEENDNVFNVNGNSNDCDGIGSNAPRSTSGVIEESNPRIPRKKGQPANSKKHSDLYTDENPKGTIHGLGFKDVATAKASVSKIRNSSRSHAHKIQAAVAMEQRAREMGKSSEAAVYRKFINSMKKKTKAMNEAKGDHEVAMAQSQLKKSARNIAKLRKVLGKKEKDIPAWMQAKITDTAHDTDAAAGYADKMNESRDGKSAKDKGYSLRDWFKGGGWKQTGGKYDGKPCAKQPGQTTKPYCRDADDRAAMSKDERSKRAAKKRAEDPNPNRKGKAKIVTQESYSNWRSELEQLDEFMGLFGPKTVTPKDSPSGTKSVKVDKKYPARQNRRPVDVTYDKEGNKTVTPMKPGRAGLMQYKYGSTWGMPQYNSYEPEGELVDEASFEIGPGHRGAMKGTKIYNKGKGTSNPNEKDTFMKRTGPQLPLAKGKKSLETAGYEPEGNQIDERSRLDGPEDRKKDLDKRYDPKGGGTNPFQYIPVKKASAKKKNIMSGNELEGELTEKAMPKNVKKIAKELDAAVEMHKSQAKRLRKAGVSEEIEVIDEKKDACYHKVKSRYDVWPSAYASGALVKCRKVGAKNWGNKTKKEEFELDASNTFADAIEEAKKCWKGYEKKGTQKLFGKTYNRCVKKEEYVQEFASQATVDKMKREGGNAPSFSTGGMTAPNNGGLKGGNEHLRGGKKKKIQDNYQFSNWRDDFRATEYETTDLITNQDVLGEDWTKKSGKDPEGGLNEKGRKSYERENPGSDLKRPSKKVGNKRRASFCARMKGMKKKLTSAKTANDPDSRINKSLRAWNC